MASINSDESKLPKDTHQDMIDDVERGQVGKRWTRAMMRYGVEARGQHRSLRSFESTEPIRPGILPVPPELRTDSQYSKIFFVWFSMNFNILSFVSSHLRIGNLTSDPSLRFSAGTLGPAVFGLGLRDSCLVILFFNIICAALPSYL